VLTEILKGDATRRRARTATRPRSSAGLRQINASFGQFSMDTLTASTGALASDTPATPPTTDTEAALQSLGADRDELAGKIRMALWNAEFNGQKLDQQQARTWIDQANSLLDRASALAASFNSSSDRRSSRRSATSWSSTRRTTASTTSTVAGKA
jgi:hypothetical protein